MPKLAVMETAEWYRNDQITSTKSMFHLLAQLQTGNPSDFLYSNFVDESSFKSTLKHFRDTNGVRYIYIGSHGADWKDDRLATPARDTISRTELSNRIGRRRIRGVFLSSCMSDGIAEYVSEKAPYKLWVAGYGEEVDWIQSCAFEMLFWQKVFEIEKEDLGKTDTLNGIVDGLQAYRDLFESLSFSLWTVQGGVAVNRLAPNANG